MYLSFFSCEEKYFGRSDHSSRIPANLLFMHFRFVFVVINAGFQGTKLIVRAERWFKALCLPDICTVWWKEDPRKSHPKVDPSTLQCSKGQYRHLLNSHLFWIASFPCKGVIQTFSWEVGRVQEEVFFPSVVLHGSVIIYNHRRKRNPLHRLGIAQVTQEDSEIVILFLSCWCKL